MYYQHVVVCWLAKPSSATSSLLPIRSGPSPSAMMALLLLLLLQSPLCLCPTNHFSLSLSITQLNVTGGGRWLVERPLDQFANFYYFIKQEWTERERKREAREGGISRARTKMTLSRFVSSSPVHSIKRGRKLKKLINPIKRRDNRREIIS